MKKRKGDVVIGWSLRRYPEDGFLLLVVSREPKHDLLMDHAKLVGSAVCVRYARVLAQIEVCQRFSIRYER
jgi:hypothetical protein